MSRTVSLVLWLVSLAAGLPAHSQTTTRATLPPAAPAAFQPGVWIDWRQREVHVQTRVVLQNGALEFLACWPGKEHESIVRVEASATHVYMALGLIGLTPGHPPRWDPDTQTYSRPAGDLVDIRLEWEDARQPRTADAYEWLHEIEYGRTPLPRPWVFAGSLRLSDGRLAAEASGVGVALVDFPDSLICRSRSFPSRSGELWAEANSAAIPAPGTVVRMILRPAVRRPRAVELDFRGVAWVDGRYCSLEDLIDLIHLMRQADSKCVQTISAPAALRGDIAHVCAALFRADLPGDAFIVLPVAPLAPARNPN